MIKQLMTRLNNTMNSDKYQQDKEMITQLVVFGFKINKKNYRLNAADLSKQKTLDADLRAIQQVIFTGKTNANIVIYYILE